MLLLLSGVAAALLSAGFLVIPVSAGQWQALTQDAFQLNEERNRLIHFGVDYISLYGSSGAGPGHMPCPDTDGGSNKPGPNPPCGSESTASGRLPDGVTRSGKRIAFTNALNNRSRYAVSRALVNNPSLPVNWMGDTKNVGISNEDYVLISRPSGQARVIKHTHLVEQTKRWVLAWLVVQSMDNKFPYCEKLPAHSSPHFYAKTVRMQAVAMCVTVDKVDDNIESSFPVVQGCDYELASCSIKANEFLTWFVSSSTGGDVSRWQGVSIEHHWFVKNQWYEFVKFEWHQTCSQNVATCKLSISDGAGFIGLHLFPVSGNT